MARLLPDRDGRAPLTAPRPPGAGPATAERAWHGTGPFAGVLDGTAAGPWPVRLGAARLVQADASSCGPAVLGALALAGDPVLARHVRDGGPDAWRALQVVLRRRAGRAWPGALGTPPWGAARAARFGAGPDATRYRSVLLDDATARGQRVLAAAGARARAGTPVPLYVGGDLATGVATAVPRHVVLLVAVAGPAVADPAVAGPAVAGPAGPPDGGDVWHVYEPSSGAVHRLPADAALPGRGVPGRAARAARRPALGGWTRFCWALLPGRAAAAPRGPER
ncbi:hypothetical protein [Cellulomonas sp. PhB143]|uniref:hypothetical protein n=1 Tax=Cellulomonas sp. PhB143 TaxID=2485186 RepID=UPI0011CE7750|nr:hypothetical protein [Cellulomonas sp. PhB143]